MGLKPISGCSSSSRTTLGPLLSGMKDGHRNPPPGSDGRLARERGIAGRGDPHGRYPP